MVKAEQIDLQIHIVLSIFKAAEQQMASEQYGDSNGGAQVNEFG